MKTKIWTPILVLAALSTASAFDDKDDVKAAAKKLTDSPNYSWTSTTKNNAENAAGGAAGRFGGGPVEGKTEKDGVTWIQMKQGEAGYEAVFKGEKFAFKLKDQWMGSGDVPGAAPQGGRPDPSAFMGRFLKNIKPGAKGVADALDKIENFKSEGDGVYSGTFTPEGAKDQLAPKVDGAPAVNLNFTDTKGSIKLWVKDGMLVKVESTLQGKMTFGQREREINRTTTTEFKDVGSTKIELPEEAKKKLE